MYCEHLDQRLDVEKIIKTYKFKTLEKPSQAEVLNSWIGTCRFLYNLALEHRILHWKQWRNNQNYYDQANQLSEMKKVAGYEWLKETPAQVLQQALKDLDKSFKRFWTSGFGFPRWKKKSGNQSIRFPDPKQFSIRKVTKRKALIKLPKIGEVRFRLSRSIEGEVKNCTIKKESDGFYITICCEVENNLVSLSSISEPSKTPEIGIDRGITESLVTSTGEVFELPKSCFKTRDRIKVLQRRLRKQKRFSSNWKKSQSQIRKLHTKIVRTRTDFLHKTSTELVKNHDLILLEDLKIKNMSKSAKGNLENPGKNVAAKSGLNREILFQGWGIFETQLAYKTSWVGKHLELVNPKFTSQICSECDYKNSKNRKGKIFECLSCGHEEDADFNAAKNIKKRKLKFRAGHARSACGDASIGSIDESGTSKRAARAV